LVADERNVTNVGDPYVVALHYRVEHSESVTFGDDPQPIEQEFESFRLHVTEKLRRLI